MPKKLTLTESVEILDKQIRASWRLHGSPKPYWIFQSGYLAGQKSMDVANLQKPEADFLQGRVDLLARAEGKFIDRPTPVHKFTPNRAGECQDCIFPKEHSIHNFQ